MHMLQTHEWDMHAVTVILCYIQELGCMECDARTHTRTYVHVPARTKTRQTLPVGSFACPECYGIETYDEQLASHMAIVRARIASGEACHLEIDMFVQTVPPIFHRSHSILHLAMLLSVKMYMLR